MTMAANSISMGASSDQMSSETRKLTCHSQNSSEQLHTLDTGTVHFESSGKTNQIDSEFFDNELGTGESSFLIDEKSPKVSDSMTDNSVIQQPKQRQCDLDKTCQSGEGTCSRHNTLEQANALGKEASSDQMISKSEKLTYHNHNTAEQLQTLDPGTAHFELSEKTNQIGSELLDDEKRVLGTMETSSLIDENPPKLSDSVSGNSVIQLPARPQCDIDKSCQIGEGSCFQQNSLELGNAIGMDASSDQMSGKTIKLICHNHNTSEQLHPLDPRTAHFEVLEKTNQIGSGLLDNGQRVLDNGQTISLLDEKSLRVSESRTGDSVIQHPAQPQCDLDKICQTGEGSCFQYNTLEQVCSLSNNESENKHQLVSQNVQNEPVERTDANEQLDPPAEDIAKGSSPACLQRNSKKETHVQLGCKDKITSKSLKKKYMLRSSDRVLRSRMCEKPKPPESNTNLANVDNDGVKRRGSKKRSKGRVERVTDEFSRIRTRLKYLLNRVSYEQSLIDAYSGEGWKGHSLEKLKPEKELHRAKSEILQLKLKIRELFRHLDTLCAEGRLPPSLFDSEGEICSEDIFCAKCKSKDLTTGNDIILCDGACDRGFHQFCLEPPLLSENIPPDDEGWLCPGCDCKDDCLELLNDSLGTSLSVCDAWERVLPEAAAAAGNKVDDNLGLPSDDSDDDDDYNPDVAEDEEVEGGRSSSDESANSSASEEIGASRSEDPYLGLPSDDSEDNDYDPNAAYHDKDVAEESSSSDFTSDSEDLADLVKGNTLSGQDNDPITASSLLELDPGQEASTSVSGKRHIGRLDYKKLYDETCQNAPSDTSDDEDWTATTTTTTTTSSRKKKFTIKGASVSPNGKASILDQMQKETAYTPRRNTCQNNVENMTNSPNKSFEGSKGAGSNDKNPGSSTYKRLGEDVVKVLYKNFKENQYPDRATKESLAQGLGLTFQQVSKWFENARWSFRNSSRMEAIACKKASQPVPSSRVENEVALGDEKDSKSVSQEGNVQKSKSPSSRKRKHKTDAEESNASMDIDSVATNPPAGSPRVEVQRSHKMKTKKRK